VALLLGIVVRGVAFTYRHYDEYKGKPDKLYSWLFALSSLWTSIWLGVIIGACVLGRIDLQTKDAHLRYIAPWFNSFCLSTGLFLAALFAFLAATFLISEAPDERMKKFFHRRALLTNFAVMQTGGFLFISAEWNDKSLASELLERPLSLLMLLLAALLSWMIWPMRRLKRKIWSQLLAGSVVLSVLLGFFFMHSPALIVTTQGYLNFSNTAAPEASLKQLLIALVIGLVVVLPSLFLLFWIFKFKSAEKK
jgi:cytochrome d ubiquinol oxidase subunit II